MYSTNPACFESLSGTPGAQDVLFWSRSAAYVRRPRTECRTERIMDTATHPTKALRSPSHSIGGKRGKVSARCVMSVEKLAGTARRAYGQMTT